MLKTQYFLNIILCFTMGITTQTAFARSTIDISINGVNAELEKNIRQFLSLERHKNHETLGNERIRRLYEMSSPEISKAIQPYGYYRPLIESELNRKTENAWQAVFKIDAGKRIPVSSFNFILNQDAEKDPEFQKLLTNKPFNTGDPFSHIIYDEFKNKLARLAADRGYVDASFTIHQVVVDLSLYEVNINLNYNAGQRYKFGKLIIEQDSLNSQLLEGFIDFAQGDPYSSYDLIKLQQALTDSEYFKSVEITPLIAAKDNGEIPVHIKLTPRKRHRYSLGLGYGTDTGARTKFSWEIPGLNKAGHRINTDARVSEIEYSLGFRYRIPVLNPRTDELIYSAGVVNEKTDSNESTTRSVGTSLNRKHGSWRESLTLNYQQEDFTIAGIEQKSSLLIPTLNWSRIWGNNFINTIDGLRFNIGFRGASENILSDTDFYQLQSDIKAIGKLSTNNRIILRGEIASTWTNEFDQLPSSVRFFAGGAQSVRGYAYETLGPVNSAGDVIGGRHLLVGSLEYEHLIIDKWSLALFYDAGNAMDNFNDDLEKGAGIGLRWKSPIGPFRIDLANAISDEDRPWRIHINIGPDL